jgi:hypothetical protein
MLIFRRKQNIEGVIEARIAKTHSVIRVFKMTPLSQQLIVSSNYLP